MTWTEIKEIAPLITMAVALLMGRQSRSVRNQAKNHFEGIRAEVADTIAGITPIIKAEIADLRSEVQEQTGEIREHMARQSEQISMLRGEVETLKDLVAKLNAQLLGHSERLTKVEVQCDFRHREGQK